MYNHNLLIVLDITDYYLFDRSTAYSIFDFIHIIKSKDNQIESTDSPSTSTSLSSSSTLVINNLDKRKIITFFTTELFEHNSYQQKLDVFMDNFTKVTISHYHPSKATWSIYEYDILIYPKINHNNINIINEYKHLRQTHYKSFLLIFYGSIIGKLILMQNGLIITRYIYIPYLT